jgi:hypothetical protein
MRAVLSPAMGGTVLDQCPYQPVSLIALDFIVAIKYYADDVMHLSHPWQWLKWIIT